MEKPEFIVGSEKRFAEFISKLDEKDVIAYLTHTDLDGLAAARVVQPIIDANILRFVDYSDINESLLSEFKERGVTKIVMTDLSIDDPSFVTRAETFAELLIIDHHLFEKDFNSAKTVFLNPGSEFCATYLCYYLFSKIQNLEKYDWLVACASLSDYMVEKNRTWMQAVYTKYGDDSEVNPLIERGGLFADLRTMLDFAIIYHKSISTSNLHAAYDMLGPDFKNLGTLRDDAANIEREISDLIERYKKEREEINGRYFWYFDTRFRIASKLSNLISKLEPQKTVIIVRSLDGVVCNVSVRRQDKGENAARFLKSLVSGLEDANAGGHIPAAGGQFLKKDLEIFKKRLAVA